MLNVFCFLIPSRHPNVNIQLIMITMNKTRRHMLLVIFFDMTWKCAC